jgi:hypothetical protein
MKTPHPLLQSEGLIGRIIPPTTSNLATAVSAIGVQTLQLVSYRERRAERVASQEAAASTEADQPNGNGTT